MGPLCGFDLWNPSVTRKGGPLIFPFPLRFFWDKLVGPRWWATLVGALLAFLRVPKSGCLFHQLWHKLLGVSQATMGLTGGSEYPQSPQRTSIQPQTT